MNRGTRRVILANLMVPIVAWIVWDQLESRALAREVAALAARGEPTTTSAISKGADTQDRRHAARVYAAAVEHAAALQPDVTFRLARIDVDSQTAIINLDELERTYPQHAPYLQLIHQAAPLEFNGFGSLDDEVRVPTLTTLGHLCAMDADLHSARDRPGDAATALASCARLWRTMATFSRFQLSQRLLGSTRILLRHGPLPPERLASLQSAFVGLPDTDSLADDVRGGRARFIETMDAPRASLVETILRGVMRPWIARTNRQQLRTFEEALALTAQPWPQKFLASAEMERRYGPGFGRGRRGVIARQVSPPGLAFAGINVRPAGIDLAARRTIVTALAVERFRADHAGETPASLDALVPKYLAKVPLDPLSGKPIVYARSATSYVVYSVDTDMKDDGGALYGLGSKAQRQPQQQAPHDLGIRVDINR